MPIGEGSLAMVFCVVEYSKRLYGRLTSPYLCPCVRALSLGLLYCLLGGHEKRLLSDQQGIAGPFVEGPPAARRRSPCPSSDQQGIAGPFVEG